MITRPSWSCTYGNRIDAAEKDLLFVPRVSNGIGVVFCHGAGGSAGQTQIYAKGLYRLAQGLARLGYHLIDGDMGGPSTFGNDTLAARFESARQVLIGRGCEPEIVTIGASMGNLSQMRFMADHPEYVRCAVGLIPAIDIEQLRINDWNGIRAMIETAWGLGSSDPVPERGVPQSRVAEMTSVPWAAWYGSGDTVVDAADVIAMAAALGPDSEAIEYDTTLEHSDPLLAALPIDDIITWIEAHV